MWIKVKNTEISKNRLPSIFNDPERKSYVWSSLWRFKPFCRAWPRDILQKKNCPNSNWLRYARRGVTSLFLLLNNLKCFVRNNVSWNGLAGKRASLPLRKATLSYIFNIIDFSRWLKKYGGIERRVRREKEWKFTGGMVKRRKWNSIFVTSVLKGDFYASFHF